MPLIITVHTGSVNCVACRDLKGPAGVSIWLHSIDSVCRVSKRFTTPHHYTLVYHEIIFVVP